MLLSSAKKLRYINHHKTPASEPSLTGVGMSLDQVKYSNKGLPAFIITEHWLKPKNCCPASLLLSAKLDEDAQTTTILTFPVWCGFEFGSKKIYLSMSTSF